MCNGRYGLCFNEPICRTCHLFLFPEKSVQSVQEDVDHDSMVINYNKIQYLYEMYSECILYIICN